MTHKGWIAVDFDGTLAEYDGFKGHSHTGEPIPLMVARVQAWLAEGRDVRVFTARVSHDGSETRVAESLVAAEAITEWCREHIGRVLPITCMKDSHIDEIWDDKAIQIVRNTGIRADGGV